MPVAKPLVRVLRCHRPFGRCKDCGMAIEWAVNALSKWVALNRHALVLRVEENERTHLHFDVFEPDASHHATCVDRRHRRRKTSAPRAWAGGRR